MEKKNVMKQKTLPKRNAYRDRLGREYFECPGAYNSAFTRAMAHDMLLSSFLCGLAPAKDWALSLLSLDDDLMRMFDDEKAGRKLLPYNWDLVERLLKEMSECKKDLPKNVFIDKWFFRVMYLSKWAYAMGQREQIREDEMNAGVRCINENGEQISGVSEEDERVIKHVNKTKNRLITAYLKAPADDKGVMEIPDHIAALDIFVQAILQGKTEELARYLRGMRAAKDFEKA